MIMSLDQSMACSRTYRGAMGWTITPGCLHMDWVDLYVDTCLEQYNYTPMANLCTLHYAWGQLLYDQTVSELHVYLQS